MMVLSCSTTSDVKIANCYDSRVVRRFHVCGKSSRLNPGQAKSETVLQTTYHGFNRCESSCVTLALDRRDGPR